MNFGVVVFPGSNCDHDAWFAASRNPRQKAECIWHHSESLGSVDAVILPGALIRNRGLELLNAGIDELKRPWETALENALHAG